MARGDGVYNDKPTYTRKGIGTGYIIIPQGVVRSEFVARCLRLEKFSILVEKGGVMHDCFITKSALKDISFPAQGEQLGSKIIFFTEEYGDKAVITGVVGSDDQTDLGEEEITVFKRSKDGNYALFTIDGNGRISIDIMGDQKGGRFEISVRDEDFDSEINLSVKGKINLFAEGDISINASGGEIRLESERDIIMLPNELKVGKADQAMVRGDELKRQLDKTNKLVDAIKKSLLQFTPAMGDGGTALKTFATTTIGSNETGSLGEINSEQSFLQ